MSGATRYYYQGASMWLDVSILAPILEKLKFFSKLKHGWKLGAGKPFTESTLKTVELVARAAASFGYYKQDVFPGKSGDVTLTVYDGESDQYEFRVHENLAIDFLWDNDGDSPVDEREELTLDAALKQLRNLRVFEWHKNIFCTSTFQSGNQPGIGSGLSVLRTQVMEAASQWLIKRVSWPTRKPVVFASTPTGTIQVASTSQRSSGNLSQRNSFRAVH